MKKIFILVAFTATTFVHPSFAQGNANFSQPTQLLTQYYAIKDALVSGNYTIAATKAGEFVTTANSMDAKTLPETGRIALLKDANDISKTQDIKKQRESFAGLSDRMFDLAKTIELTTEPIYKAYCPMKKTSWLSSEAAIKNPYYGNAMLTCGKVVETIK